MAASSSAASPFIGRRVHLALTSGGSYTGAITALDPVTRAISIRDDRTTATFTIRSEEVRDMRLLDDAPPQAGATGYTAPQARRELEALPADFHAQAPTVHAAQALEGDAHDYGSTHAGAAPANASAAAKKRTRKKKKAAGVATSSAPESAPDATASASAPSLAFNEDFDFEGALKSFDKARIWDEIRRADQTDPETLLVSHNRAGTGSSSRGANGDADGAASAPQDGSPRLASRRAAGTAASGAKSGKKGRGGQTKLGIHEMVLSDDEDGATTSKPKGRKGVSAPASAAADEPTSIPSQDDAASSKPAVAVTESAQAAESAKEAATQSEEVKEEPAPVAEPPASPSSGGEGLLGSLFSVFRSAMGAGPPPSAPPTPAAAVAKSTKPDPEIKKEEEKAAVEDKKEPLSESKTTKESSTKQDVAAAPAAPSTSQAISNSSTAGGEDASKLKDEVARLLERISILEALGGVEVRESSPDEAAASAAGSPAAGSKRWTCTLRPTGPGEPQGHLRFGLATTISSASSSATTTQGPKLKTIRYLGALPSPAHSAADATEALPAKYAKPMGLSAESAGVFVRRLREGVYGAGR